MDRASRSSRVLRAAGPFSVIAWPADNLAGRVLGHAGYEEFEAQGFTHRMAAATFVPVIFIFGSPFVIHAGGRPDAAGRFLFLDELVAESTSR